ncbi:MAG: hypothetical protein JWN46_3177 [Acidimicrobiales bacterium]|nr:hypothetical protein [Acidimicrobiales bacterium]
MIEHVRLPSDDSSMLEVIWPLGVMADTPVVIAVLDRGTPPPSWLTGEELARSLGVVVIVLRVDADEPPESVGHKVVAAGTWARSNEHHLMANASRLMVVGVDGTAAAVSWALRRFATDGPASRVLGAAVRVRDLPRGIRVTASGSDHGLALLRRQAGQDTSGRSMLRVLRLALRDTALLRDRAVAH